MNPKKSETLEEFLDRILRDSSNNGEKAMRLLAATVNFRKAFRQATESRNALLKAGCSDDLARQIVDFVVCRDETEVGLAVFEEELAKFAVMEGR